MPRSVQPDLIGIVDAVLIVVGQDDPPRKFRRAVDEGAGTVVVGGEEVVSCRPWRRTTGTVPVTDAIGAGTLSTMTPPPGLAPPSVSAGAVVVGARSLKLRRVSQRHLVPVTTLSPSSSLSTTGALLTRLTCAVGEGAGTVVVGGYVAEVAGCGVGTARDFIAVTNAVSIEVVGGKLSVLARLALPVANTQEPSSSVKEAS